MIERLNIPNVDAVELRKQRDELLEALIENTLHTEECGAGWDHYRNIEVIESATQLPWPHVKQLAKQKE